eukprot:3167141-Pyramimonas_sp.AAC.1
MEEEEQRWWIRRRIWLRRAGLSSGLRRTVMWEEETAVQQWRLRRRWWLRWVATTTQLRQRRGNGGKPPRPHHS